MRLPRSSSSLDQDLQVFAGGGLADAQFSAIESPQTPSSIRSPATCGGKCRLGWRSQARFAGAAHWKARAKRVPDSYSQIHIDS